LNQRFRVNVAVDYRRNSVRREIHRHGCVVTIVLY
jgi:hypothetical protein